MNASLNKAEKHSQRTKETLSEEGQACLDTFYTAVPGAPGLMSWGLQEREEDGEMKGLTEREIQLTQVLVATKATQ